MWTIPHDFFDYLQRAVFVSDEHGTIRCCNSTAASLLDCDPALVIGTPCWKIGRMRTPEGELVCGVDCSIRRELRKGVYPASRLVQHCCASGVRRTLRLLAFPTRAVDSRKMAVLHVLEPLQTEAVEWHGVPGVGASAGCVNGLCRLSLRERDVLSLLATGMTPPAIATTLRIRKITVRNHVQGILQKLHLHRRMDAVLAWVALGHRRTGN